MMTAKPGDPLTVQLMPTAGFGCEVLVKCLTNCLIVRWPWGANQNYTFFTYHKTNLHYHIIFNIHNIHFRKQINTRQNTLTNGKTNLQITSTWKGMYQLQGWTGRDNGRGQFELFSLILESRVHGDPRWTAIEWCFACFVNNIWAD